jgi:hypothetical protein
MYGAAERIIILLSRRRLAITSGSIVYVLMYLAVVLTNQEPVFRGSRSRGMRPTSLQKLWCKTLILLAVGALRYSRIACSKVQIGALIAAVSGCGM